MIRMNRTKLERPLPLKRSLLSSAPSLPIHQPVGTETRKARMPKDLVDFDLLPNAAHVNVKVVAGLFDCEAQTVWARLRRGAIPAPRKFGAHTRWNVGDLRKALAGEVK
jgi:hypothetical protein